MEKYPFLRRAARVIRILAWVELVIGIIGSIIFGAAAAIGGGFAILVAIFGIFYSVMGWIFLLATAEVFLLLIDVEENTRKAAEGHK